MQTEWKNGEYAISTDDFAIFAAIYFVVEAALILSAVAIFRRTAS